MKIAQIICQYRPYKSGMSEVAYYYFKELQKKDFDVTIFTPAYDTVLKKAEVIDNIKIKRLTPVLKIGNAGFIPSLYNNLKGFNIIHLHYPFFGAALICAIFKFFHKKKVKLVLTYHMDTLAGNFLKKLIFTLYRYICLPFILSQVDYVIVSSMDYAESSFIKKWISKHKEKVQEIPFGVDVAFQKREHSKSIRQKYNIKEKGQLVLFVAGMDKAHYFKGIEVLLKSFSKILPSTIIDPQLVLVGDGDNRFLYEDLSRSIGIEDSTVFTGKVSDEDLIDLYNECNIFVLPSINRGEAFGIVSLQAMACAKPIIVSDLPGVRSLIKNNIKNVNGILVKPGNIRELSNAIQTLLENKELAQRYGNSGYQIQQNGYTWKVIGGQLNELYKKL